MVESHTETAPAEPLPPGLYVVATPIGNRSDLSPRALDTLRACDRIACEDTRTAQKILAPAGIEVPLVSYHEHNEAQRGNELAAAVAAGERIGLITDAGTPAISDPGFRVVRACHRDQLPVIAVPGPCAAVAALSISGLPSDGFLYLGFLPPKTAARRRTFEKYRDFEYTLVLYESKHRIEKFLDDVVAVLGENRCISVARELTKRHETVHSGPAKDIRQRVLSGSTKGEFVISIAKEGFEL